MDIAVDTSLRERGSVIAFPPLVCQEAASIPTSGNPEVVLVVPRCSIVIPAYFNILAHG